jgi:DNA-3-methyladenine glycosylase
MSEHVHLLVTEPERETPAVASDSRRLLASGPGKLAEAFGITRLRHNGKDLTSSDLTIVDDGFRPAEIASTARVGITKAVEAQLRHVVAGSEFLSKPIRRKRR